MLFDKVYTDKPDKPTLAPTCFKHIVFFSPFTQRHFHIWKHLIKTQTSWSGGAYRGPSEADLW